MAHNDETRQQAVSIHAPANGRQVGQLDLVPGDWFQSTPPRMGDSRNGGDPVSKYGFNPRPREGATKSLGIRGSNPRVSIHAPAKGRHLLSDSQVETVWFQSTPPRRGDISLRIIGMVCIVSIHAPAKGRLTQLILEASPFCFKSLSSFKTYEKTRGEGYLGRYRTHAVSATVSCIPGLDGDARYCRGEVDGVHLNQVSGPLDRPVFGLPGCIPAPYSDSDAAA